MHAHAIEYFINDYRFLSNFGRYPFVWMDRMWDTAEHAYQWAKCLDEHGNIVHAGLAAQIECAPSPGAAKKLGKAKVLNTPEWRARRVPVMRQVVRAKFQLKNLRQWLIETDPAELIEGNFHGDKFWGRYNGEGSNNLGIILMDERRVCIEGSIFD